MMEIDDVGRQHSKLTISIDLNTAAFDGSALVPEVMRILETAGAKVAAQICRDPECICNAPEIDDKLLDINGNTVGSVRLE